jgi:hypothetical protein
MNLTEEQSDQLEEMAYLLIPLDLIAINFGMEYLAFMMELREIDSPVRQAYYKGILRQKMELHSNIVQAAKNGSHPAQEQIVKMLNQITGELRYG